MTAPYYPTISWIHGIALDPRELKVASTPDDVWHLTDGTEIISCVIPSSDLARELRSRPLIAHSLQVAKWSTDGSPAAAPLPLLISAAPDPDREHPLRFLPEALCPIRGVVEDTMDLIHQIEADPLRRMVERVFLRRDVTRQYWRMSAAWQHHHAFPGGLALHSLEVAQDLEGQTTLAGHERDLCIAAGLLHDIGKVWAYTDEMRLTEEAKAIGHERIGLRRLNDELDMLEYEWADGAHAMAVLLDGSTRRRPDGSMPSALVARLKAADQLSCERERQGRDQHGVWVPRPWQRKASLRLVTPVPKEEFVPF